MAEPVRARHASRMGATSNGGIPTILRAVSHLTASTLQLDQTQDSSGVRGLLRHRFARPTGVLVVLILVVAAFLRLGSPLIFFLLALVIVAQVVAEGFLSCAGRPISPSVAFRVLEATWPVGLGVLSAAAWNLGDYHGEVVVVVCLLAAGLVALAEPMGLALAWALISGAAVTIGAGIGHAVTAETLVNDVAIGTGILFGNRLRRIVEAFLGTRRNLMQDVGRVSTHGDPFAAAGHLLESLVRWTPLMNPSIVWFTEDGRSIFLSVAGDDLPPHLASGRELPPERNAYMRAGAENGPWISGWTVTSDDDGYTEGIASLGITSVAYVPMMFEGRLLGLVCAGLGRGSSSRAAAAEYLPALVEFADAAGSTLGPGITAHEERSTAGQLIEDVLRERRYWPVFQPIRDLATRRVVGFEALTRFDAPIGTQRMFIQAGLVGRQRDLELATLRAAVAAERKLPAECWLSVNSSPELLADSGALAPILRPATRPIVIELSEHEAVADYEPIASALDRLGPERRLAVDDAGAGFASLRHILEIRPAFVKLDIGLVQGVATDPTRRALVAGFVHFAQDARFTLIAEGIEDSKDLGVLRHLGVTLGQGFHLGAPVRAPEVGRELRRSPVASAEAPKVQPREIGPRS
jgi:EAL domain-containing protein (putative c-di-GMP-specific phosphodiesterase class I)